MTFWAWSPLAPSTTLKLYRLVLLKRLEPFFGSAKETSVPFSWEIESVTLGMIEPFHLTLHSHPR